MANSIVPFDFNGFEIRTLGTWDAPMFAAADVCKVLEIANTSQACESLDEDEKGISIAYTLGGSQELLCVTESGLYSLVIRSRKPQAKAFKKWITSEVIPSIRKTGGYQADTPEDDYGEFAETVRMIKSARAAGIDPREFLALHNDRTTAHTLSADDRQSPHDGKNRKPGKIEINPKLLNLPKVSGTATEFVNFLGDEFYRIVPHEDGRPAWTRDIKRSLYRRYLKWIDGRGVRPLDFKGFAATVDGARPLSRFQYFG